MNPQRPIAYTSPSQVVIPLSAWRAFSQIERLVEEAAWLALDHRLVQADEWLIGKYCDYLRGGEAAAPFVTAHGSGVPGGGEDYDALVRAVRCLLGSMDPKAVSKAVGFLGLSTVVVHIDDARAWRGLCKAVDLFHMEEGGFIDLHRGTYAGDTFYATVDPCFVWAFKHTAEALGCTRYESMRAVMVTTARNSPEVRGGDAER